MDSSLGRVLSLKKNWPPLAGKEVAPRVVLQRSEHEGRAPRVVSCPSVSAHDEYLL